MLKIKLIYFALLILFSCSNKKTLNGNWTVKEIDVQFFGNYPKEMVEVIGNGQTPEQFTKEKEMLMEKDWRESKIEITENLIKIGFSKITIESNYEVKDKKNFIINKMENLINGFSIREFSWDKLKLYYKGDMQGIGHSLEMTWEKVK